MTGLWPGDIRTVATLTFDVDGATEFLAMDQKWANHPSLMSMCAFGPEEGTSRILDLLETYDTKATFFVPGYIAEQYPNTVWDIYLRGHEIAHHGYMHEVPSRITKKEQAYALEKGVEALQGITGERPLGYRAPGLDTSDHTINLISEEGFLYDSSLMGNDVPYFVDTKHGPLVELPVHWALTEAPHYIFAYEAGRVGTMASVEQVYRNWTLEFDGAYQYGRGFTLILDPGYSGHLSRLVYLERLIQHIRAAPGTAIMRAVDIAKAWKKTHTQSGT